jgi:N-acetyl sugar amidotransferase
MKRCARCLYPDTKPDLHFSEDGVCSACRAYEKRATIDWPARQRDLEAILETGRNGSGYDCIVPSSGGKDSHYQVLKLIALGARPLVVTATTCHLTPVGRANIDNLARHATTIEVTANRTVRAKLNRLGLQMVGDISWPEHVAIHRVPFRIACDLGIPLVFYGECANEAYGGPPGTEETREMTQRWVSEFGGFLGLRPADMIGMDDITEADMLDYAAPDPGAVARLGMRAYFLGQFFEWDSRRNADIAAVAGMTQTLPSRANWLIGENEDNAQTGLHDHFAFLKFGFGRACAQVSMDIRAGRLTREEGLAIVEERDGLFPEVYAGVPVEAMLERIGMTRADLDAVIARFAARPARAA